MIIPSMAGFSTTYKLRGARGLRPHSFIVALMTFNRSDFKMPVSSCPLPATAPNSEIYSLYSGANFNDNFVSAFVISLSCTADNESKSEKFFNVSIIDVMFEHSYLKLIDGTLRFDAKSFNAVRTVLSASGAFVVIKSITACPASIAVFNKSPAVSANAIVLSVNASTP